MKPEIPDMRSRIWTEEERQRFRESNDAIYLKAVRRWFAEEDAFLKQSRPPQGTEPSGV